jgi:predicted Zn-dependent protease
VGECLSYSINVLGTQLATTSQATKGTDQAIADWPAALRLQPDDSNLFFHRGTQYLLTWQLELALPDLDRYVLKRPGDPFGYTTRSSIYAKMGDEARAKADLTMANKLNAANSSRLYGPYLSTPFGGVALQ